MRKGAQDLISLSICEALAAGTLRSDAPLAKRGRAVIVGETLRSCLVCKIAESLAEDLGLLDFK